MNLRRTLIPALITAAVLLFGLTQAAVCASADSLEQGSLTVIMRDAQGEILQGAGISIFQVAEMKTTNGQLSYSLLNDFDDSGVALNNTMTSEENKTAAAALLKHISISQIVSESILVNSEGKAVKTGLSAGIYLVMQSVSVKGYYDITPFLAFLPSLNSDGSAWIYNLTVSPKEEAYLGIDRDPTITPNPRPTSGVLDQNREPTPRVNAESDGMGTLSDGKLPQTGMFLWPVALLAAVGILIFCLGWADINLKERKDTNLKGKKR